MFLEVFKHGGNDVVGIFQIRQDLILRNFWRALAAAIGVSIRKDKKSNFLHNDHKTL